MKNVLKIKNPETGEFEPIAAISGADGAPGANGQGVPTGGTTGQVLRKTGSGDYEAEWSDKAGDSERLGGVAAAQYALKNNVPAYNLLDNSDFRNPVAQAGIGGKHGGKTYVCDRWYDTYGYGTYSLSEGTGITLSYGTNHCYCVQTINNASQYHGKAMTLAVRLTDGKLFVNSGTYLSSGISFRVGQNNWLCDLFPDKVELVVTSGSIAIAWAALYEGAYDASTLPPYIPKGKHVEMLNCNVPLVPYNILDNSNFADLVAQAGLNGAHGSTAYIADRWKSASATATQQSGYTTLSTTEKTGRIAQQLPDALAGKTVTAAAKVSGSSIVYCGVYYNQNSVSKSVSISVSAPNGIMMKSGTIPSDATDIEFRVYIAYTDGGGSCDVYWAALYEGAYTADTLPAYVPVGKHVEMLNCGVPLAPHNLLDNSNFTNPVNQRGQSSYTGSKFGIDRWRTWNNSATITITSNGIKGDGTEASVLYQKIEPNKIIAGKSYTVSAGYSDGSVSCKSGVVSSDTNLGIWNSTEQVFLSYNNGEPLVRLWHATKTIAWVALYEGAYTTDTLPAYVPKGYAAELAECQRYYYKETEQYAITPYYFSTTERYYTVMLPAKMRIAPTVTYSNVSGEYKDGWVKTNATVTVSATSPSHFTMLCGYGTVTETDRLLLFMTYEASADL